jgi:hypothetical protein
MDFGIIFVRKKPWARSTGCGPRPASVHGGPRQCGQEHGDAPVRAWCYGSPAVAARGGGGRGGHGGVGGALTGDRAAMKWLGDDGKAEASEGVRWG